MAAYPTANNETAEEIHANYIKAQQLCEAAGIPLLSGGADGAKAERGGQKLMRAEDGIGVDKRLSYKVRTVYSIFLAP